MALVLVKNILSPDEFEKAKEDYKIYIKITTDLTKKAVVLGGEYHADAEKMLLGMSSKQEDVWGGGVNLETGDFETNAIINLRRGNDSTEILDPEKREKFLKIAKKIFENYVK